MTSGAYSIRIVSARTGISVETLRVWERRYGFPRPERREGGSRLYRDDDIARLQWIARARDAGYRPGDVMALPDAEIARLVGDAGRRGAAASPPRAPAEPSRRLPDVDSLVHSLERDDVEAVRSALRTLATTLGPRDFVTDVAHPFMVQVGDAWERGRLDVRHEHVASSLLSTQLRLLLTAYEVGEGAPVVVLATLPGEAHALGLEMVAVYLATERATPRLLGADTPVKDVVAAAAAMRADVVGISIAIATEEAARDVTQLSRGLRRLRPAPKLWLGGEGAEKSAPPGAGGAGAGAGAGGGGAGRAGSASARSVVLTTSWAAIDAELDVVRAGRGAG